MLVHHGAGGGDPEGPRARGARRSRCRLRTFVLRPALERGKVLRYIQAASGCIQRHSAAFSGIQRRSVVLDCTQLYLRREPLRTQQEAVFPALTLV